MRATEEDYVLTDADILSAGPVDWRNTKGQCLGM